MLYLYFSDCASALARVEQQLVQQQAQLSAILRALDHVGGPQHATAAVTEPRAIDQHIEIRDFDYGSSSS